MSSTPSTDGPDELGLVEPAASTEPRRRRGPAPYRLSLVLVAVLAGSALFVGGYSLGAHVATTPGTPTDEETRFGPF